MNYRKVYIMQKPSISLTELFMLGIEKMVNYFRERNQPKEIEIPPGTIIFDYNPALVYLTKERLREMVPPEIRKDFEEITGLKLNEKINMRGQLPEGVQIIQFKPKEAYGSFKKNNYQR